MKVKGRSMSSKTIPESKTTRENVRPRSLWKVMSPNPSVLMTVSVQ